MQESSAKHRGVVAVTLTATLPWVISFSTRLLFGPTVLVQDRVHESLEVIGACLALIVAILLWLQIWYREEGEHLLWIATGLSMVALLDGAHALLIFGAPWAWLGHDATLIGGLVFALVWITPPPALMRRKHLLAIAAPLVAVVAGLTATWWSGFFPLPLTSQGYSVPAKAANATGGAGFALAALFFLRRYLRRPSLDDLTFCAFSLLLATAALAFGFAPPWSPQWWTWHGLRLLAFSGLFAIAFRVLVRAEAEVRRLNQELEARVLQRTAQLESANKELEAFTYSVSHDLRAPLRHIAGFSKILTEEYGSSIPADAQHHLQRIEEGTRHMGQLVDDLLNLARVGRCEIRRQMTGLASVLNDVINDLKPEYEDRHVQWNIGDLPFVECDPGLMRQVFQNLLSNALKFTRPRSPAVIEVGVEKRDGGTVIFIQDNGVGFSMKYADKLFGVFQRLHRSEDFEGTGVGLATVQRIIHKHGGRIWVEAELDRGARFYFSIGGCGEPSLRAEAARMGEHS